MSCQPVSLNESHEFAELLNLKKDELPILEKIYELESKLFGTRYSETHNEWMKLYLQNQKISIEFMEHICIPYIDAMGKIWSCPCKKEILSDIKLVNKAEKCNISIQCMTCLKHIENIHKV